LLEFEGYFIGTRETYLRPAAIIARACKADVITTTPGVLNPMILFPEIGGLSIYRYNIIGTIDP